jgi:hypothetical protein
MKFLYNLFYDMYVKRLSEGAVLMGPHDTATTLSVESKIRVMITKKDETKIWEYYLHLEPY